MRIALGVTGGIAAYKSAEIVRLLQDCGVSVQVVMTRSAQEFVRPLTFAALTGQKVITGLFGPEGAESVPNVDSAVEHIAVAQEIDALLVVPATADVIAKFANGLADDFLTTLPDASGCAPSLVPVYRAYNNGFARGVDSNHRLTTNVDAYAAMLAAGWIGEGVVMCAPR